MSKTKFSFITMQKGFRNISGLFQSKSRVVRSKQIDSNQTDQTDQRNRFNSLSLEALILPVMLRFKFLMWKVSTNANRPFHGPVKWYGINYAGNQLSKQRKVGVDW